MFNAQKPLLILRDGNLIKITQTVNINRTIRYSFLNCHLSTGNSSLTVTHLPHTTLINLGVNNVIRGQVAQNSIICTDDREATKTYMQLKVLEQMLNTAYYLGAIG